VGSGSATNVSGGSGNVLASMLNDGQDCLPFPIVPLPNIGPTIGLNDECDEIWPPITQPEENNTLPIVPVAPYLRDLTLLDPIKWVNDTLDALGVDAVGWRAVNFSAGKYLGITASVDFFVPSADRSG
jgi:hypothetical protein